VSVELLRQLDAYGDHVASLVDHVDAAEAQEKALLRESSRAKREWLGPVALTAGGLAVVVLGVVGLAQVDRGRSDSVNFEEIGLPFDDGEPGPRRTEPAATAAPTTAASAQTLAPAAFGAPDFAEEGGNQTPPDAAEDRDIVFVADLKVSVTDAPAAAAQATTIIESLGGFLSGERSTGGADATSVLTFKVPPAAFGEAVDRLGELGVETGRTVDSADVTEEVVDLRSQITSAEISVARLQAFLAAATDIDDIARIERELTSRERDLERLRGRLQTLESQVALATIVARFSEAIETPKLALQVSAYVSRGDDGAGCPGARLLEIDAGERATVCLEITNTGKTQLTGVELSGAAPDLLGGNLVTVEGSLDEVLEPGDVVILAADVTVDERIRAELVVTALPVNEAGEPVEDRAVTQTRTVAVDLADPGGLPGFADAWDKGLGALRSAGGVVLIAAGAVIPWLWLPALIALFIWWRRRR
jgi:hypothetical protein